tara:strand:- start:29435 stop:30181 length:747 start_codon:yes stop_codon:yes gene_type:complete
MQGMMLHCGGKPCNLDDLKSFDLPKKTKTYNPLSHFDFANNVSNIAKDLWSGFKLTSQQHAVTSEGKRYFGLLTFQEKGNKLGIDDLSRAIAIRNSYDKSMKAGIALGATVFVCDNLMLSGDVVRLRKHTKNIHEELEDSIISVLYKFKDTLKVLNKDKKSLEKVEIHNNLAYEILGYMLGNNIITPRQFPKAKKEWLKPTDSCFEERNLWSLYNAVTSAMKSTPPNRIMESHRKLHGHMLDRYIDVA